MTNVIEVEFVTDLDYPATDSDILEILEDLGMLGLAFELQLERGDIQW